MKINEIKHNHNLTDLLKVLLFSILMLLPFIDVGVRCGYVMLNKNAYQSYSGTNQAEYEVINLESKSDLIPGETYVYNNQNNINISSVLLGNSNNGIYFSNFEIINCSNSSLIPYFNEVVFISFYNAANSNTLYNTFKNANNQDLASFNNANTVIQFKFTYESNSLNNEYLFTNTQTVYQEKYLGNELDNVFEYSVNKLESSNLYNWTTQTAIYSGISQMTSQLGITGNIIPIILCYWFFMTIIYIILDIVIKLFTILTHFIGSKTSS